MDVEGLVNVASVIDVPKKKRMVVVVAEVNMEGLVLVASAVDMK